MPQPAQLNVQRAPVVLIGSGISGLLTALKIAAQDIPVLLLTKSRLDEGNSRYAQGGIAAVLPQNDADSVEQHVRDTLAAGAGLCRESVVRALLADGADAIADLLAYGVPFDRDAGGSLALGNEAAHSVRRILHAGGDATGLSIEMTLVERVKAHPRITVWEYAQAVELLWAADRCYGCRVLRLDDASQWLVLSEHVVLATGGVGQLFRHTTNPTVATGDGLSLALTAGVPLQDMEFVQFHPTAFYHEGRVHFLISEALRGEGGLLRNAQGEAFMADAHPQADLAPRDIVTRGIFAQMQAAHFAPDHVWLDATHLPADMLRQRFPSIDAMCRRFGVDLTQQPIPVAPAAHYLMGGVPVNLQGQTALRGLYAVGEVAYTGLHGANRLASNSLLECVVLARRVAALIGSLAPDPTPVPPVPLDFTPLPFRWLEPASPLAIEITERLQSLRQLMNQHVGIQRSERGLMQALWAVRQRQAEAEVAGWEGLVPDGLSYVQQLGLCRVIIQAALARKTSCGAHYLTEAGHAETPMTVVSGSL